MHILRPLSFICALCVFLANADVPAVADSFSGEVVGVSDGDTITVMHEGREEKVRFFGIDCPEKAQAFGQRAKQATSSAVFGKIVTVDKKDTDRYGRTVGEVFTPEGKSLNRTLVEQGMCWWYRKYSPHDSQLAAAESNAKAKKLGLWADPNPLPPWEFRNGKANEAGSIASTGQAKIVGNLNSHVYHPPGCPGYSAMKEKNKVYFESEPEAVKAGFRRAGNCR